MKFLEMDFVVVNMLKKPNKFREALIFFKDFYPYIGYPLAQESSSSMKFGSGIRLNPPSGTEYI